MILALTVLVHVTGGPSPLGCDLRPGQTWIVAGQSNGVGYSTDDLPDPAPVGYSLTSIGELKPTADPLRDPSWTRRSPWPFFSAARTPYAATFTVHTAVGGSCLVFADPTAKPAKPEWDPDTGAFYARMLERVEIARASGFPPPTAVLFDQGGCEALFDPRPADELRIAYRDGLVRLADAVWRDLGVPIVVAQITADPEELAARPDAWEAVRTAIREAADLHPSIVLGPDQATFATFEGDGVHVRNVDVSGAAWADAVEAAGW